MALFSKKTKSSIADSLVADAEAEAKDKLKKSKGNLTSRKTRSHVDEDELADKTKKRKRKKDDDEGSLSLFSSEDIEEDSDILIDELQTMMIEEGEDGSLQKKKKKSAKEHNKELQILNLFGVRNKLQEKVDEEEEELDLFPIPEEVQEQEPDVEYKPDLTSNNVISTLAKATEFYDSFFCAEGEELGIHYKTEDVAGVSSVEGKLILPTTQVYVNGKMRDWDEIFEIKVHDNETLEVDTGVCLSVPDGFGVEVSISDENREKYSVDVDTTMLSAKEAMSGVFVKLLPRNGAYVSKLGRFIECQLVKL